MIVWRVSAPGDNGKSSASTRAPYSRHQGVDRSQQGSRPRFRFDRIRAVFAHRLVTPPPEITRKCRFWCRRLTQPSIFASGAHTHPAQRHLAVVEQGTEEEPFPVMFFRTANRSGSSSHQAGQRGTDAVSATQGVPRLGASSMESAPTLGAQKLGAPQPVPPWFSSAPWLAPAK